MFHTQFVYVFIIYLDTKYIPPAPLIH